MPSLPCRVQMPNFRLFSYRLLRNRPRTVLLHRLNSLQSMSCGVPMPFNPSPSDSLLERILCFSRRCCLPTVPCRLRMRFPPSSPRAVQCRLLRTRGLHLLQDLPSRLRLSFRRLEPRSLPCRDLRPARLLRVQCMPAGNVLSEHQITHSLQLPRRLLLDPLEPDSMQPLPSWLHLRRPLAIPSALWRRPVQLRLRDLVPDLPCRLLLPFKEHRARHLPPRQVVHRWLVRVRRLPGGLLLHPDERGLAGSMPHWPVSSAGQQGHCLQRLPSRLLLHRSYCATNRMSSRLHIYGQFNFVHRMPSWLLLSVSWRNSLLVPSWNLPAVDWTNHMSDVPLRILLPFDVPQCSRGVPTWLLRTNRKPDDVLPLSDGFHVSITCHSPAGHVPSRLLQRRQSNLLHCVPGRVRLSRHQDHLKGPLRRRNNRLVLIPRRHTLLLLPCRGQLRKGNRLHWPNPRW